jgi:hypothetical protein
MSLFPVSTVPHVSPIPPPQAGSTGYWVNQYPNVQYYDSPGSTTVPSPGAFNSGVVTGETFGLKRKTTQTIQINFPKDTYLGTGDYTIKIPKLGDMVTRIRLAGNFNNNTIGESIINQIDFIVNSNVLESLKGDFIKVDTAMNLTLEKVATSNALVNGSFSMIDIPFYLVKKGFFMVSEPDIRVSFNGDPTFKITTGFLLVDYTLIESPPAPTFLQRIRQVQDISVVGNPGCTSIKVDTAFVGPVYQIYFTVENLNTATLVPNIANVAFYCGANFERFNLSGTYLLYTEPLKRYKGIPGVPVYLYSFALEPSNIHEASGQMNFSRLEKQRFEITLIPIVDPVKVTIWTQSHNFTYFYNSNCVTIFNSAEYIFSNSQLTTTIPSLPLKLNNEVINTYAKVNTSFGTPVPLSNTLALTQTLGTIDNQVKNMVLSSPGYSNVTCNMYQSSCNPFLLQFSFNSAVPLKVLNDPQLNTVIILLSNGSIIDQRNGTFNPSLTGTSFDMVLDLYGNPVVSTSTQIVTLQRGTYTIKSSVTVGAPAALYFDNSNVWASYYSSPNCVLLNLTTGYTFSNNFGSFGNLTPNKFCNSSDYVQFLSSTVTYVFQFSTGVAFIKYYYNDGTLSFYIDSNGKLVCSSNPTITFYGTPPLNYIFTLDSCSNFIVIEAGNILSNYTLGSNSRFLIGTRTLTTLGKYGTGNLTVTGILENQQNHTYFVYGYNNSGSSAIITPGDPAVTNYATYTIPDNTTFVLSIDSNGLIFSYENDGINLINLENYNPRPMYFDPSVFSGPLNPIRYPPASMSSNVVTFTGYQYGSGTYTISSTVPSQTNNLIKGFNCAPSWTGGSSDYILIKAPSGIPVNGVFIGGAVSGTVTVNIVSADFISLYPIASGTLTNNILQFSKTYTTPYLWQIIASGTLNDIALLYIG